MLIFHPNLRFFMDDSKSVSRDDSFVSIVILNYNGKPYLENCISSVFQTSDCKFEVILIDNGSIDNSAPHCKQKFPQIRLFENPSNLGMYGRNIGIDNAQGNFIVFLDSDTTVKPNWLKVLLESYYAHGDGLYQGKILDHDNPNIILSAGNLTNIFGFGYARGHLANDSGQFEKFQLISFPVGACIFSSLNTIKKIGYFDESKLFFIMLDDVDYACKALLMNIPSFYEPKSIVYHIGSTGSKLDAHKLFLYERNRWICLLSFYSSSTLLKIFPILLILETGLFFIFLIRGQIFFKIKSFFSLIKLLNKIKKRKKALIKTKILNDKEIITHFVNEMILPKTAVSERSSLLFGLFINTLSKFARNIINL